VRKVKWAAWKGDGDIRHEVETADWCCGNEWEEEIVGIFEGEYAVDSQVLQFASPLGSVVKWRVQPDIKFQSRHNIKR
jgi:hypothetical protein